MSEKAETIPQDRAILNVSKAEGPEQTSDKSSAPSSRRGQDAEKFPPAEPPGSDAPDGGLAAWLVIVGAWCVAFCSFGWVNSVGVFQEYYQNDLLRDYSSSTVSWIPSLQIFFMMGMGPIVGSLHDKYGPRWLLLGGSFLHVLGIMMASLGKEYYQILLAQGVCSAIGVAAIFQPTMASIAGWFNVKRGAAFGIITTGSSVGGVIFPIMVRRLISDVGFGWAMRISAFLILFLLIIANLTVRTFHPPSPQNVTLAQVAKPLKEAEFVLVMTGFFCFSYGTFVPINFLPVQAIESGMDLSLAQYLVPMLNAASLFGRLSAGFLGDRIGRYNIFVVVCYISGIWILALWIPDTSDPALIAFAILFGFFSGAYVSLISPLVMQISPMAEIGFRTGLVYFVSSIGGLTTNPINGAILDTASGTVGMKIFSGVFCLAGTTFILMARIRRTGWKLFVNF